jgi:hypothetical protein
MTRRVAMCFVALVAAAAPARAQQAASESAFGITDNSFLVEESFNQEAGIFQNIFVFTRNRHGLWSASFTQEWPVKTMRHQLSFTLPFQAGGGEDAALGNVLLNYRFQLSEEEAGRPACSPRFSVIAPSAPGETALGWQVNLPVSKRVGRMYLHGNAGATRISGDTSRFTAASAIWAARPMLNLMLEVYAQNDPDTAGRRTTFTTVVPGVRTGWNFGDRQFVVGAGVPITRGAVHDTSVLGYISYELPFKK